MNKIFKDILVLDLTRLLPGPFASLILANQGARVIKIEEPGIGDYTRVMGEVLRPGETGYHHILNVNKESLTLNFKKPQALEIFYALVKCADVVMESYRPGVAEKLGIDYKSLSKINSSIIYCSLNGYGNNGPYAKTAGHDINYLSHNGVLSYCGINELPRFPGVQIADLSCGLHSALGISFCLYKRAMDKEKRGEYIDVSLFDSSFVWNCMALGSFLATRRVPKPGKEMLNHGLACYNTYLTKDGRAVSLAALEKKFWDNFCEVIGKPEWKEFNNIKLGEEQKEMEKKVGEIFKGKTAKEWDETFKGKDCCCEVVQTLDEVIDDPQTKARDLVIHEDDGLFCLGNPIKYMNEPCTKTVKTSPKLGENNKDILKEFLGYDEKIVEQLSANKVI
eukprot:TRINITY_DN5124_c0_g1_i1.p1 TRINITY_DN5124_c0_g1~~TRINITY_DN5124_c0_g1_i1.p1  ORF type:complete len:393 (+),score=98.79 TRINITY_DN5124_c0_g1_i1:110-1288(+)